MRHIIFEPNPNNTYKVAILIKESAFKRDSLIRHYVHPLITLGINGSDVIGLSLKYENNKAPVKLIKPHIETLLKACDHLQVTTLLVADSTYFKKLTGMSKAEAHHGYVKPCVGYEHINVILSVSYQALFHNPSLQDRLSMSIATVAKSLNGVMCEIGHNIIHSAHYPETNTDIAKTLVNLLDYPSLTCDVETFSLKHYKSGIGTIAFAWDQHHGVAFSVDYRAYKPVIEPVNPEFRGTISTFMSNGSEHFGYEAKGLNIRSMLKQFFTDYKGKLIFHNIGFDAKILIYNLWMDDITDTKGMYEGLDVMTKNFDCTQLITYLATNSCSGNKLGLKHNAHEFAGNYAEDDIKDIRRIPEDKLLKYNLVDCLSTWFVHNKNYPILIQDQQEDVYLGLMKDSLITLIQMMLTGMPMCMDTIEATTKELQNIQRDLDVSIANSSLITKTIVILKLKFMLKDFKDRKAKAKHPEKLKPKAVEDIILGFNPCSGSQVAVLLHEVMNLPVIETTTTGLPATDEKTLNSLINHTDDLDYKKLITDILELGKVTKIITTFLPAFREAQLGKDGIYYLFGSYKLGGTISNRLSSSDPNLQNMPSGSTYGKAIKKGFKGNDEWVFCGADFHSLEDYINALLTKDPNKLKIYLEGYDSHSFRAYYYWPEKFKDIPNTVAGINSIKDNYSEIRQLSKGPTFALTFAGTWHTLVKKGGFPEVEAKRIEANYKTMYKTSMDWVYDRLKQASVDGYVTLAFGVRLRTPILKQCLWDTPQMPYEASAEGRSAGNAVSGQSYGVLTCRAANELRKRIRNSPYLYDIKISANIHDSIYCLIKSKPEVAEWLNTNLIECMQWQDLPEIQHDKVKLGAELDLFPSWADPITIPNGATQQEIMELCNGK